MTQPGRKPVWRKHGRQPERGDEYLLMLRVGDWKLERKTDTIRSVTRDPYAFPPFAHITLYGPFTLPRGSGPLGIFQAVESASEGIPGLPFLLWGYLRLKGTRGQAITHQVLPARQSALFHERVWHAMQTVARSRSWIDRDPGIRKFHVTHGYNLRSGDADRICSQIQDATAFSPKTPCCYPEVSAEMPNGAGHDPNYTLFPEHGPLLSLRVIVQKNGTRIFEFDLPAREWLPRPLMFNAARSSRSLTQYRLRAGIEPAKTPPPGDTSPFIASDLHLGHGNIIRYCRRPFSSTEEMDRVLMENWNRTVSPEDEVIYLGDLRYGRDAMPASVYRKHLHGKITWVRGNHDEEMPEAARTFILRYLEEEYCFVHDPADAPPGFGGWVIHGHHHNNDLKHHPLIDILNKRINASIELTGYRPVRLLELCRLCQEYRDRGFLEMIPDLEFDRNETKKTG